MYLISTNIFRNGNLTDDGMTLATTFTWNAEGRPHTITFGSDSTVVIYDALGRAVENQKNETTYTQILYGVQGNKLALLNGSSLVKAFMPLVAGAQAVYDSTGLLYYRHPDWLGSARLASTPARTVYSSIAYAPFGEDYAPTSGTVDKSFTGQNQDTTNGLYDFMHRRYSPMQGRWISPDPAGLAAVNPADPQTWNRYAYVTNSPLSSIDPLGLRRARISATDFSCLIDGVAAPCRLAIGLIEMDAAYPVSTAAGNCIEERSGTVWCGGDVNGEGRTRFDPDAYKLSLSPFLRSLWDQGPGLVMVADLDTACFDGTLHILYNLQVQDAGNLVAVPGNLHFDVFENHSNTGLSGRDGMDKQRDMFDDGIGSMGTNKTFFSLRYFLVTPSEIGDLGKSSFWPPVVWGDRMFKTEGIQIYGAREVIVNGTSFTPQRNPCR